MTFTLSPHEAAHARASQRERVMDALTGVMDRYPGTQPEALCDLLGRVRMDFGLLSTHDLRVLAGRASERVSVSVQAVPHQIPAAYQPPAVQSFLVSMLIRVITHPLRASVANAGIISPEDRQALSDKMNNTVIAGFADRDARLLDEVGCVLSDPTVLMVHRGQGPTYTVIQQGEWTTVQVQVSAIFSGVLLPGMHHANLDAFVESWLYHMVRKPVGSPCPGSMHANLLKAVSDATGLVIGKSAITVLTVKESSIP